MGWARPGLCGGSQKAMHEGHRAFTNECVFQEAAVIFCERNLGCSTMRWRVIGEALVGGIRLRSARYR